MQTHKNFYNFKRTPLHVPLIPYQQANLIKISCTYDCVIIRTKQTNPNYMAIT